MFIKDQLTQVIHQVLLQMGFEVSTQEIHLEQPALPEHGDWSTNIALVLAKRVKMSPVELSSAVAKTVEDDISSFAFAYIKAVKAVSPGFVNFYLYNSWLHQELIELFKQGEHHYAAFDIGKGKAVQVEFISANPTGPLHVGNGWWGCYGDALARLLSRCGWMVSREYYVNDTGGQIRELGASILAAKRGKELPEGGYKGEYISLLAASYDEAAQAEVEGDEAADGQGAITAVEKAGIWAAKRILENIKTTCNRLGIIFDKYYSQREMEQSGALDQSLKDLDKRSLLYRDEGALWFKSSSLGDSRDRVLVKSDGEYTYLAADIAYHRDKFILRGFDRVIDVFGADHHGHVPSLLAGVEALGVQKGSLEVKIGQMVSLVGGIGTKSDADGSNLSATGAAVKMSKREGNVVLLDSLIDEIGIDAVRLLSLLSSIDQAVTLDLDLVKKQSMENPVYYVQYAHARIASIQKFAEVRGHAGLDRVNLNLNTLNVLRHPRELDLIRCLIELPDIIMSAYNELAPFKVTTWVRKLAGCFHGFYHDCRVIGDDVALEITEARLWLTEAVRIGLKIGLELLGVSLPESM
ncbi:MAG: arginine--tRNA ligase [Actinobacteria bacterium]|nr:arginine--tRNA ligase [Actinomycetota bacterium]MCL6105203.1 arginine--tRNA ligase [Actinomycetota bacterium]